MEEDPRVTAKKQEAHNLNLASIKAVQAQQVLVAQAKSKAALAAELARQEAVVKVARAHATALEQRFASLKKALG
jgi:hypothetical protein